MGNPHYPLKLVLAFPRFTQIEMTIGKARGWILGGVSEYRRFSFFETDIYSEIIPPQ